MRTSPLLAAILAGLGACGEETTVCLTLEPGEDTCPSADDVARKDLFELGQCGDRVITQVSGDGRLEAIGYHTGEDAPLACCYDGRAYDPTPQSQCMVGRPYDEAAGPCVAAFTDLSAPPRALAWLQAAAEEHASVASFARLALELMAHGAPLDLLRDAHAAAVDEVGHTDACLRVARRFGARGTLPGPFPFTEAVEPRRSLVTVATSAVRQGCLVETLGAALVTLAAERCHDPDVVRVLRRLAADEVRHAVLSWRVVAWALRVGGPEVRQAVREALAAPVPPIDVHVLALRTGVDARVLHEAAVVATADVLTPAARALLAA